MPPFLLHGSQYVTNSFARILVRDSLTDLKRKNVGCKVLHFINNEDEEALGYKTLRRKDAVAFSERIRHRSPFAYVLLVFSYMTTSEISLIYV